MKSEFVLALNQISAERTLPRDIVARVIETALIQSYRKYANVMVGQNVAASVDMDSGDMRVFLEKEVVESVFDDRTEIGFEAASKQKPDVVLGDCIMVDVTPKDFGRIAAQNAKQMIVQKLREAERDFQFNTFSEREGEIVNGMITSITPMSVTVNLGRIEAQLPKKEMIPGEKYEVQQRIRAYVSEVKRLTRGPQVVLSRAHKNMLKRLLEIEVPEIAGGAVEIKAITREAGSRSKVAVAALQAGVDPVGACVGQRGARIQNIIQELKGEKIDIIEWHADASVFITKALGPAKVMSVHPTADTKNATVIVPDDQLSLAIGREGQNARLAARLTGWRIDIKSGSEGLSEALNIVADHPEAQSWLGAEVLQGLPMLRELLVRQRALPQTLSPEEFALVKRTVDSVHQWKLANLTEGVDTSVAAVAPTAAPIVAAAPVEKAVPARPAAPNIPAATYAMSLDELGLSPRVTQHIAAAGIVNVGQLMEYSTRGDEGLLSIPNIGSKALAEIKQSLEKVVGVPVAPTPEPAAVAVETVVTPAVEETPEEAQKMFFNAVGDTGATSGDDAPAADEDDERNKSVRGKKNKKGKERPLVYDEELGRMVPARTHFRDDDEEEL
jgi:transcription termination/antitermination protein NusA